MRERLTKKQRELFDYLEAFIKSNGYAPSYREIMHALGYKSVSTVSTHVQGLITRGYIKKSQDEARSLEIIPAPSEADTHQAWLKRTLQRKLRTLEEQNTDQARKDSAVLTRTAELLGLE